MQLHNPPLRYTFRIQGPEAQPGILQTDPQQVMIEFFQQYPDVVIFHRA